MTLGFYDSDNVRSFHNFLVSVLTINKMCSSLHEYEVLSKCCGSTQMEKNQQVLRHPSNFYN